MRNKNLDLEVKIFRYTKFSGNYVGVSIMFNYDEYVKKVKFIMLSVKIMGWNLKEI